MHFPAPCAGVSVRNSRCDCRAAVRRSSLKQRGEQTCPNLPKGSGLLLPHSRLWFSFEEGEKGGRWQRQAPFPSHCETLAPQRGPCPVRGTSHSPQHAHCHAHLIYPAWEIVKASQRHSWMYQAIVTMLGKAIRDMFFIETSKSCFSFCWLASNPAEPGFHPWDFEHWKLEKEVAVGADSVWNSHCTRRISSFLSINSCSLFSEGYSTSEWALGSPQCPPLCCRWYGCSHRMASTSHFRKDAGYWSLGVW